MHEKRSQHVIKVRKWFFIKRYELLQSNISDRKFNSVLNALRNDYFRKLSKIKK